MIAGASMILWNVWSVGKNVILNESADFAQRDVVSRCALSATTAR